MAAKSKSKRRLGRGLGSLISTPVQIEAPAPADPDVTPPAESGGASAGDAAPAGEPDTGEIDGTPRIIRLPLDAVRPNARQPRQTFDPDALNTLAASITRDGLMQPIVVRPLSATDGDRRYELVAGERRWRAGQIAGLTHLPAVVHEVDDQTAAEWALIENLQREDLNPIDRAEAYARLIEEFEITHQDLADRVGESRPNVSNLLRLNDLDQSVKSEVRAGRLSAGQAKAILGVSDSAAQRALAAEATRAGWSVRQLEARVRQLNGGGTTRSGKPAPRPAGAGSAQRAHLDSLERALSEHLGAKVRITSKRKKGSGQLRIDFYSLDHFESLMAHLGYKGE